jgi:hypothetical protein
MQKTGKWSRRLRLLSQRRRLLLLRHWNRRLAML